MVNDSGVISLDTLQDWLSEATNSVNQMIDLHNNQAEFIYFAKFMLILIAVMLFLLLLLMIWNMISKD